MATIIQGVPCDFESKKHYSPVYKKTLTQHTCIIPGGGCVYYRANKGDVCPFCAFPSTARSLIKGESPSDLFDSWALGTDVYKEMYLALMESANQAEKIAVFNGGSFFPGSELSDEFQRFVYEDIAARSSVRQLMVESYPTFISRKKLSEAKAILGGKDLMVGIGFESKDDYVRNTLLKKGIDKGGFETKVKMMQDLGVQVFVYTFLKAPGLSETQALNEALETIEYLSDLGVDEVALSCAFVPPDTDLEVKYKAGEFRPPWLWSIVEIIKEAKKYNWPLSVGGFEDYPPPVATPNNCPSCDDNINALIDCYRMDGKLLDKNLVVCNCQDTWKEDMSLRKTSESIALIPSLGI